MYKILIVEDEISIANLIKYALQKEGFEAMAVHTGTEGLKKVEEYSPNLVLLDIMLPDIDGLTIAKQVTSTSNIPIIMLTAKNDITDKLIGLEYGADDYITKPFDIREVVLRIKSILKRAKSSKEQSAPQSNSYTAGNITLDIKKHICFINGAVVDLTPKEFDLLKVLMENKDKVLSRPELLEKVWEFEYLGDTRTVDIHVQRLRKKLGDDNRIATVFGVGYRLMGDED